MDLLKPSPQRNKVQVALVTVERGVCPVLLAVLQTPSWEDIAAVSGAFRGRSWYPRPGCLSEGSADRVEFEDSVNNKHF